MDYELYLNHSTPVSHTELPFINILHLNSTLVKINEHLFMLLFLPIFIPIFLIF